MATRLTQEDRNAVDLLLDKTTAAGGFAGKTVAADRLRAAEKIMHLLDAYEPSEPSADLVAKTLRRIDAQFPMQSNSLGTTLGGQSHA